MKERDFIVLSVSRLNLRAVGIPEARIRSLSDQDMEEIAFRLQQVCIEHLVGDYDNWIAIVVGVFFAEKGGRDKRS